MTAIPAYTRTWSQILTTGTPGLRIPYVSLIDTMQNTIYQWKTLLLANTCTVVWSASAGTGPTNSSDHTDRITNSASWTPRATIAGASQAWCVLLDGNGGQFLIAYTGSADDQCYMSYSPGALFALAGTTNRRPTSSDELVMVDSTVSVVGSSTSIDRVLHGICSTDGKAYRMVLFRQSVIVGVLPSVENFTPALTAPATAPNPVFASCWDSSKLSSASFSGFYSGFGANTTGGKAAVTISSSQYFAQAYPISWFSNASSSAASFATYQPELQGTSGYLPWPNMLFTHQDDSAGSHARGLLGTLIDFWTSAPASFSQGDGFGTSYQWIQMGCWLWPNPSNVAPTIA